MCVYYLCIDVSVHLSTYLSFLCHQPVPGCGPSQGPPGQVPAGRRPVQEAAWDRRAPPLYPPPHAASAHCGRSHARVWGPPGLCPGPSPREPLGLTRRGERGSAASEAPLSQPALHVGHIRGPDEKALALQAGVRLGGPHLQRAKPRSPFCYGVCGGLSRITDVVKHCLNPAWLGLWDPGPPRIGGSPFYRRGAGQSQDVDGCPGDKSVG